LSSVFLQNIEKEAKKEVNGTRPNPYYCPDFGKRLLKLSKYFLLWTAVLSTSDKNLVATSARSEEYFRELKNLIFHNKSNRIDKFIILHLRSLVGTMKVLNASNSPTQHKSKPDNSNLVTDEKKNCLNCDSSNDSCILNEPNDNEDYNLQVKHEKSLPSDMSKHANFLNETYMERFK